MPNQDSTEPICLIDFDRCETKSEQVRSVVACARMFASDTEKYFLPITIAAHVIDDG